MQQSRPALRVQWDNEQRDLLFELWKDNYSFEEIAIRINEFNLLRAKNDFSIWIPKRTTGAVAFQCRRFGLVTEHEFKAWETKRKTDTQKARHKNLYVNRKAVFERDGRKCVICKSLDNLEYAHIIPFRESHANYHREAVTLCKSHHKHFDGGCIKCVEKAYKWMSAIYKEYSNEYTIKTSPYGHSRIIKI